MHHIQSIILLVVFFNICLVSKAQDKGIAGWLMLATTYKIDKSFTAYADVQLRSSNQLKNVQTTIIRPGINYSINKNIIATAGYAFIENRRTIGAVSGFSPEHRIWEQVQIMHPLAFTSLNHRFRLEQRFIGKPMVANNSLQNNGNTFANRLRYFFRTVIPFNGTSKFTEGAFAALQNEIFVNIGDKTAVNKKYFDQNRAYGALGYRFSQKMDIEAGYLNQYISGLNKSITNNHNIQLAFYVRL